MTPKPIVRRTPMRVSITIYDDNHKKIFNRNTVELNSGLSQLQEFLDTKVSDFGLKNNILEDNLKRCAVCKQVIRKGKGTTYKGKQVHKTCIAEAVQWL